MSYNHIEELPAALNNNLPKDAMEVYVAAYNQACSHSAKARRGIGRSHCAPQGLGSGQG